jgi:iron complex outermembrane receptor protein
VKSKLTRCALAAAVGAALSSAAPAFAQEGGLEEIVVTAARRTQDLQEVPVSVVAITGGNLELRGVQSMENLSGTVPNLNITGNLGAGTTQASFTVRGIPRVGTYVDGIWQVNGNGLLTQEFVDIDRIEVLRGPQGTLYGRDSTGGAVRIITKQPGEEFGATVRTTAGSLNRQDVQIAVDVPFSDKVLSKWTVASLNRDGYIQDLTVDQKNGGIDQQVARGDILWRPTDKLSFRFNYQENESEFTEPRVQDAVFPQAIFFNTNIIQLYTLAGAPITAEAQTAGWPGGTVGKWQNRSQTTLPNTIDGRQASVDIHWDITDKMSLQFLTGNIKQDVRNYVDFDNTQYSVVEDLTQSGLNLFSQEIQLTGKHGRVDWVGGLYYWNQDDRNRGVRYAARDFIRGDLDINTAYNTPFCQNLAAQPVINPGPPAQNCQQAYAFYSGFASDGLNLIETDGWALFGEAQISLTDKLRLVLGARHHDQDNSAQRLTIVPGVSAVAPVETNTAFGIGDPLAGVAMEPSLDDSFHKNTSRVSLQYQFLDDLMGYVSYSEGFNAGGVSISNIAGGVQLIFPYTPETLKNYEIGMRSDWLDKRLRLNATIFHTDWEDIQASGVVRDPNTGADLPGLVTKNVGTAQAEGLEVEVNYVPTDHILVDFSLGLLDTEYTDIALGTEGLIPGQTEFSQAPDKTYNIGFQHTADLANGATFVSRLDYTYSGQYWRSANPTLRTSWYPGVPAGFDETGAYGLVNARFTYAPVDDRWNVSVFGTNLTNEYILNSGFFHGLWGIDFATVGRPREAGVSFNFNFK